MIFLVLLRISISQQMFFIYKLGYSDNLFL